MTTHIRAVSRVSRLLMTVMFLEKAAPSIPPRRHWPIEIGMLNCVSSQVAGVLRVICYVVGREEEVSGLD